MLFVLAQHGAGPCKTLAGYYENVARAFDDSIKFYKVDIDQEQELATKYVIRSVPTIFLIKDGKIQDQKSGAPSEKDFIEWIKKTTAKS